MGKFDAISRILARDAAKTAPKAESAAQAAYRAEFGPETLYKGIYAFDPVTRKRIPADQLSELKVGPSGATWLTPDKPLAEAFAVDEPAQAFVTRAKNIKEIDWGGRNWTRAADEELARAKAEGYEGVRFTNMRDDAESVGNGRGPKRTQVALFNPEQIRRPNAAFDPAKRDSRDLLAATIPATAAVGAGALAMQPQEAEAMTPKFPRPGRPTFNFGKAAQESAAASFGKLSPYMPARPNEGVVSYMDMDSALRFLESSQRMQPNRAHRLQRNLDGAYEIVSSHGPAPNPRYEGGGDLTDWTVGTGGAHPMEPSRRSIVDALIQQERFRQMSRDHYDIGNPTMSDVFGWQDPANLKKGVADLEETFKTGSDAHFPGRPLLGVAGAVGAGGLAAGAALAPQEAQAQTLQPPQPSALARALAREAPRFNAALDTSLDVASFFDPTGGYATETARALKDLPGQVGPAGAVALAPLTGATEALGSIGQLPELGVAGGRALARAIARKPAPRGSQTYRKAK